MSNGALKFFHSYLTYSTPIAILVLLLVQLTSPIFPAIIIGRDLFGTIFGSLLLLWIFSLLVFLGRLCLSEEYRSLCFSRLAGIQERDEREELIVGRAAKSSFLFTLAAILVLFFISTWRYGEHPTPEKIQKSFTLGHLDLIENSPKAVEDTGGTLYPIPASKTTLLIFILGLQLASFRYFSKKAQKNS